MRTGGNPAERSGSSCYTSIMSLKLTGYKGTRDLYPADMAERDYIFSGWRKVVQGYGYEEYMAPLLEPIDVYPLRVVRRSSTSKLIALPIGVVVRW